MQLKFWGAGTARTLRPIWMAEELGLDYKLFPIGPRTGETRTEEFSLLNPKQKIPLMEDGDFVLSESLSICSTCPTGQLQPLLSVPLIPVANTNSPPCDA